MPYVFDAELWESTTGGWVFLSLPMDASDDIDDSVSEKRGFGSVKVEAEIGETRWTTSVFPDKSRATYILPVKGAVREGERLSVGDTVGVMLSAIDPEDA